MRLGLILEGQQYRELCYSIIFYKNKSPLVEIENLYDIFGASHKRRCLGVLFVVGLIMELLGFVQNAQDVMVLFDEWLAVLVTP